MRTAPLLLALVLLVAGAPRLAAQDSAPLVPRQSAEFWLSTSLTVKPFHKRDDQVHEHKFFKKFRINGELGYRGNENLFNGKLLYTVLGLRYRFTKHVRFTFDTRYNMRGPSGVNSFRNDLQLDLSTKVGRFGLGYRFTGQHEYIDALKYRDILRNRVEVNYNVKDLPITPYAAAESFNLLHYQDDMLIGMRYTLGAQWNLRKGRSLDLGVRHDREMNLYDPLYRWIFAVSFDMDID